MPVKILSGASGSGKTYILYRHLIERAIAEPEKKFILMVPEQSSLQAQKKIVSMHERHGVFNIDVLTFGRLTYRIFDELSVEPGDTIDDTGKNLIIRKVMEDVRKKLVMLKPTSGQGFISDIKSLISELKQYGISPEKLYEIAENTGGDRLRQKLKDIYVIYRAFSDSMEGRYVTVEDRTEMLDKIIEKSSMLKNSVIAFDGFTGFTPVQYRLIEKMTLMAEEVIFTVTASADVDYRHIYGEEELFYMSRTMVSGLGKMADRLKTEFTLEKIRPDEGQYRFKNSPELDFLEKNIFRYGRNTCREKKGSIHIACLPMMKEEIRYTASEILKKVRQEGMRFRDIGVIAGDMQEYGSEIAGIFEEAEIPYFMDMKRSLINNALVEYLRSAIDTVVRNYSYESVFRLLKNGLCDIPDEETDIFENYILALGIRGEKRYSEKFVRRFPGKTVDLQVINEIREKFMEKIRQFTEAVKGGKHTAACYVRAVYDFMESENLYEKVSALARECENASKMEELNKSYGQVIELLDRIYALLGEEELTLKEFSEILDAGFQEIKVGIIPPTSDCVLVGDFERSRFDNIKVLFVLGVNEGLIPKISGRGGLLSELERKKLSEAEVELAPGEREKAFTQNYYMYLNFTKPSEQLYLLYHGFDREGKETAPSRITGIFLKMFPELTVRKPADFTVKDYMAGKKGSLHVASEYGRLAKNDKEYQKLINCFMKKEEFRKRTEHFLNIYLRSLSEDILTEKSAEYLYGEMKKTGISRIEKYAACAFSHFASYGLELEERKIYELSPVDMGSLFHKALELTAVHLEQEGRSFAGLTDEERHDYVEKYVNEAAMDYNNSYFNDNSINAYMKKRITDIVCNTVWALGEQLKAGDFAPWKIEKAFSWECDEIEIVGKTDRIDIAEDEKGKYIKIIDYKSGRNSLNFDEIHAGVKLQLMLYLKTALMEFDGNAYAGGVLYNHIDNPLVSIGSPDEYNKSLLLKEYCPSGIVGYESVRHYDRDFEEKSDVIPVKCNKDGSISFNGSVETDEHLKLMADYSVKKMLSMVSEIKKGDIRVNPYKDSCTYCPYGSICGFRGKYRKIEKMDKDNKWQQFGWEEKNNGLD